CVRSVNGLGGAMKVSTMRSGSDRGLTSGVGMGVAATIRTILRKTLSVADSSPAWREIQGERLRDCHFRRSRQQSSRVLVHRTRCDLFRVTYLHQTPAIHNGNSRPEV